MFLLAILKLVAADMASIRVVGSGEVKKDETVKIATWNLYDPMKFAKENQKERFCFGTQAMADHEWDVVAIQDVFDTDNVVNSCQFSSLWNLAVGPPARTVGMANSGLMLMSRYEIEKVDFHTFDVDYKTCADAITRKGILFAKIKVDDHYIFMYNTHLQENYHSTEYGYKDCTYEMQVSIRKDQINQVFQNFMPRTLESNTFKAGRDKLFLAGDFNIDPWGPNEIQEFPSKLEYDFLNKQAENFSNRFDGMILKDISQFPQGTFTFPANVNPRDSRKNGEKVNYIFELVDKKYEPPVSLCTIVNPPTTESQRAQLTESDWVRDFMTISDHKAIVYEIPKGSGGKGWKLFFVWFGVLAVFLALVLCAWKRKKAAEQLKVFVRPSTPRREMLVTAFDAPANQIPPQKESKEMRFHVLNP